MYREGEVLPKKRMVLRGNSGHAAEGFSRPNPFFGEDPLVTALASRKPEDVEAAKRALIAKEADAVPLLLRCLEVDGDTLRLRALSLLALLGDHRASGPVISLLRHSEPNVRSRAASALARIATPSGAAALSRLLGREPEKTVRLAAARTLVRLAQTGHDEAFRPLFEMVANPEEEARVRIAALDALPWALAPGDGTPLRALLERLSRDPDPAVARKARRLSTIEGRLRLEPWILDRLLNDLASPKLAVWRRSVSRLGRGGAAIVEPLVETMLAKNGDREFARRAVLVLKCLSARQLARLGSYLDQVFDPVPLEALVDLAAQAGSRALLARLANLVHRLAEEPDSQGPGPFAMIRQKIHLALARHGSRLAADDMRRLLEDRRIAVLPALSEAAALVGTGRELPALLRAYRRSGGVTRLALRDAVLAVCRREKIRRTDRALSLLDPPLLQAALEILGLPRKSRRRHPIPKIDRLASALLT